jgi:hypothetical protein
MIQPQKKPTQATYQSGMNADRQAVNTGNIVGQMKKDSTFTPNAGSASGNRAAQDLQKSNQFNDAAQIQRGLEAQNAQQNMEMQAARSQLMQQGMANQAQIYGDLTNRTNDQIGLAAKLQEAYIRNQFAARQQMAMQAMRNGLLS